MSQFYFLHAPSLKIDPFVYPKTSGLRESWLKKYEGLSMGSSVDFEIIECPVTWEHKRHGRRIGQLSAQIWTKRALTDFEWLVSGGCLINARAHEKIREAKISGWSSNPTPIERVNRKGKVLETDNSMMELVVKEGGARLLPDTGIVRRFDCDVCKLSTPVGRRGELQVDLSTWCGDDVFKLEEFPWTVVLSERAALRLTEARLTNLQISPASAWGKLFPLVRAENGVST